MVGLVGVGYVLSYLFSRKS